MKAKKNSASTTTETVGNVRKPEPLADPTKTGTIPEPNIEGMRAIRRAAGIMLKDWLAAVERPLTAEEEAKELEHQRRDDMADVFVTLDKSTDNHPFPFTCGQVREAVDEIYCRGISAGMTELLIKYARLYPNKTTELLILAGLAADIACVKDRESITQGA